MKIWSQEPLVFSVDSLFTKELCEEYVNELESIGFEEAPVTLDGNKGVFQMNKEVRNNTRVILDDSFLSSLLFNMVKEYLPQTFKNKTLFSLNSRFRFYKYIEGQTFKPHIDGSYNPSSYLGSELTFLIYLSENFEGGETSFFGKSKDDLRFKIKPELGQVLVFDHKQLHSGEPVLKGVKYVLRTDVMYKENV